MSCQTCVSKILKLEAEAARLRQQLDICKKVIGDGKEFLEYLNTSGLLTGDTKLKKHLVQEMEALYKSGEQALAQIKDMEK